MVSDQKRLSERINGVTGLDLTPDEYSMISTAMASSKNPDETANRFAQALTYSHNSGITFEEAYSNLDALNLNQLGRKVDVTQTGTKAVINSFKIGKLTVKRQRIAQEAYRAYQNGMDVSSILSSDVAKEIEALDNEIADLQDYMPRAWYTEIAKNAANTLSYSFNVAAAAAAGKALGAVAGGNPVSAGLATLFSFLEGYQLTKYGNWYDNIKAGVDPKVADAVQTVSAGIQAAIESYLDVNVGLVKSLGSGTAKSIASNTLKNMYVNGTLNKVGMFFTKYAINMASEGTEEFLQEITEEVFDNIAFSLSGKEAPNELKDILANSIKAFAGGASSAIILGIGDAAYETKMNVKYAQDLKKEAIANPSKETFINNHIDDEELGTASRKDKSEILSKAYDNTRKAAQEGGVSVSEAKTIDTDFDINDDFNPETDSDEARTSEQPVEPVKRMDNGRLRVQESQRVTQNSDGTESHTLNIGSRGSSTRYGYVDYTIDTQNKTVTIDQVATRLGYEDLARDAVMEVERSHEGWNIEWNPETAAQQAIKEQIVNDPNNPNRGNLQWFNEGEDVDTNIQVGEWIKKTFSNLTTEQSVVAAKLLEFTAKSQGVDTRTWINDHIQNLQSFDESGKKGAVSFDDSDIKAIIYAGENADFSTFSHETFHVLVRTSQAASKLAEAFRNASQSADFAKYVNSHKQIIKMDLDEVLEAVKDMGDNPLEWTRAQHEVAATFFESYLRDGKTFSEKLKNIFTQIADWFHKIYKALRGENSLNDEIVKAYDEILAGNPELKKTVEASDSDTTQQNGAESEDFSVEDEDEDNGLDEYGNRLYQIDNVIEKYTDKSRYEKKNIFDDVYVDSARMAESKKSNQERLNFERELASARRFSEHFDCEVYLLPPKEAGSVIYKAKHSNPDAIVNGTFIDFKENNSGNEGTIKNLFDKATKQADAVYLTISGGTTLEQAAKWINGKVTQKGNIENFGVVLSDSNGNFAEYKVKEKRLIESPFIRETGTKSSFTYNYNAKSSAVKSGIKRLYQQDGTAIEEYKGTLVVTHNLTKGNLEGVLGIGGMPMPSLAVTRPDIKIDSFGPITLVGDSQLANQLMRNGEIFDRDMWSPTAPRPEFKVDKKGLKKFDDWIRDLPYKDSLHVNMTNTLMDYQKNSPESLASFYAYKDGIRIEYCKENGIDVEIPYRLVRYNYDDRIMKAAKAWAVEHNERYLSFEQTAEFQKAIKPVVDEVLAEMEAEYERKYSKENTSKFKMNIGHALIEFVRDNLTTDNVHELSNLLSEASLYEEGKKEMDVYALNDTLDKVAPAADVEKWLLEKKFSGIFSDPMITIGRSKVPYNAQNIFEAMRRSQYVGNGLGTITYSNSLAASSGARALRTRQAVAEKEGLLGDVKDENYEDAFNSYHDLAVKNYKYNDTWDALDDSNKAIAKYLESNNRTTENLKQQLKKLDFNVTDELVSEAQKLVDYIEGMTRRYFEAKPRRIMQLSDFKYAIVPTNAKAETAQVLQQAGLSVVRSDSREEALKKIAENDTKVLWQLDNMTESSLIAEAKDFQTKDEFIEFEKAFDLDGISSEELSEIWDKAHGVYQVKKEEYTSPIDPNMPEEDKDEAFRVIMSTDEGIKAFIQRLRDAFSARRDVRRSGGQIGVYTEEDYNAIMQDIANADRVETEAAPYITALAKSNKDITPEAISKVRGMINNSLRDYRDLYSQIIGDENFAAGVYNEFLPNIKDSRANGMRITQRKDLANRIEGEQLREEIRRGTEKYDGTAEKVMAVYDKELKDLQDDYAKLKEQYDKTYLKMSVEQQSAVKKAQQIKKMESAIARERQNVRMKLDSGRRVSTEQLQKLNGWEDELNLLHEEIKELRKQDAVKATIERHEALDKLKEAIRQKQRDKAAVEAVHRYKRELYNSIVEKIPNNVDWSYVQKINEVIATIKGIQGYQNNSIMIDGKRMKLEDFRKGVEDGSIKIEGLSDYQLKCYLNTSLADLTISDLETLKDTVDYYKMMGKQMWQAKVDQRNFEAEMFRNQILSQVYKSNSYDPEKDHLAGSAESDTVKKKGLLKGGFYKTLNWNRKAQIIDNDNKGLNYDLTVEERRQHQDEMLRGIRDRVNPVKAILEETGLKEQDFYKTVPVVFPDGKVENFTIGRLAYGMLADKNERNLYAVSYGNLVTQAEKEAMTGTQDQANDQIKKLGNARYQAFKAQAEEFFNEHPEYMKVVDAIVADWNSEENLARIQKILIDEYNKPMEVEGFYMTMHRQDFDGTESAYRLQDDMYNLNAGKSKTTPDKGFTESRIDISPMNQQPVDMDIYRVWLQSVEDQENVIANLPYIRKLNRIYKNHGSKGLRSAIENAHGNAILTDLDNYINEVANSALFSDTQEINGIIGKLRGGLYTAYLGYKMSGIVLQGITSPMPSLQEVNPAALAKGLLQMTFHPVSTWKKICELSPYMEHRSMNPAIEAIRKYASQYTDSKMKTAYKQFLEFGTEGLEMIDRWAVAGSWLAVYEKKLKELGDSAEGIKAAAHYADNFIRDTQPTGDATELAPLFKSKNAFAQAFTQFQVSLNVIWNNITYDLPRVVKHHEFAKAAGIVFGYALAGMLLNLAQDWPDEDKEPEDIAKQLAYAATTQFTQSVPLLGSITDGISKSLITGESGFVYNTNQLYPGISNITTGLNQMLTSKKGITPSAIKNVTKGIAIMTGLPTSGASEIWKTFFDRSLIDAINEGDLNFTFNPGALLGRRDY